MGTRMWIRRFHAHALLHASIPQSTNVFCQDCNVIIHLDESVAHVPLLKRCFPAFPEQCTREALLSTRLNRAKRDSCVRSATEQNMLKSIHQALPVFALPLMRES